MKKHLNTVVRRIQSSPSQAIHLLITVGIYTALFLLLLYVGLINPNEFLLAFSSIFLSAWFMCSLLGLLLVLFLLKDSLTILKDIFMNTAESIYGSIVLITSFALAGYLYSIPPARQMLLANRAGFLIAVIVYFLIAVFLKKVIHSMKSTRKIGEKLAFVILVIASFVVTWIVRNM